MLSDLTWFVVVVVAAASVVIASRTAQWLLPRSRQRPSGRRVVVVVVLAIILILLCLLVRVRGYDRLDASVIRELMRLRSPGLEGAFTVITTLGDVVPSLLIATVMGLALFARESRVIRALLLPAMVLVEVAVQIALGHLAGVQVQMIAPEIVVGGSGPIPSGSVARLFVIFVLGAFLWSTHSPRAAARSLLVGQAIILIELTTRVYLGRHFVIDIVGGLIFGVLLVIGGGWLTVAVDTMSGSPHNSKHRAPVGETPQATTANP